MPPNLARRAQAEKSLWNWGHTYFGHHLQNKSGVFHAQLCKEIDRALMPGGRLVGVCPRRMGKTTWGTVITPLYAIATRRKKFVRIWCDGTKTASEKLFDVFEYMHTDDNKELIEDYGEELQPRQGHRGRELRFNNNEAILGNGAKLVALHFGAPARGKKHGNIRPELDILDDPEDEKEVANPKWRREQLNWLHRQILAGGPSKTNYSLMWLGTIVHRQSILSHLLDPKNGKPKWRRWDEYKDIYDKDGKSIWPEGWSLKELEDMVDEVGGILNFNAEMRNIPPDEDAQRFSSGMFKRYDWKTLRLAGNAWHIPLPSEFLKPGQQQTLCYLKTVMGVDLALGEKDHHDYTAYVVLGLVWVPQKDRPLQFVLEVVRERMQPEVQVRRISELAQKWQISAIGHETNAAEKIILAPLRSRGWNMKPFPSSGYNAKTVRIDGASEPVQSGLVYLPTPGQNETNWLKAFLHEAETYPGGDHKDQLDAFAYAQMAGGAMGSGRSGMYRAPRKVPVSRQARSF